ncbi:hypothetical protein RD110_15500 [Rhodoferax koreense]|uniref:Uncharacterized protein n=1 Tax=Rhodoferax koreensis TaxID=1842727 RepID=A0A1P8JXE3_9BURK|nr:hypothetical protein [Rhodoferax koreense]APW38427.1 hypothetical protein RD110_15500 [Rhodoferax koreense]
MISKLFDDGPVKAVFDHVRNAGIAAAVFSAASWMLKSVECDPVRHALNVIGGVALGIGGLCLLTLVLVSGHRKLVRSNLPRSWRWALNAIQWVGWVPFLWAVASRQS